MNPLGWQPGIQEGAADWDEDWDKLEDKEFALVKEYTLDVQNTIALPKQKQPKAVNTKALDIDSPKFVASPKSDDKSEKPQTTNEQGVGNGSVNKSDDGVYSKSDDGSTKSAPNSPFASSTTGSPHRDFVDSDIRKTSGEDTSPRNQDDALEMAFKICTLVFHIMVNLLIWILLIIYILRAFLMFVVIVIIIII